VFAATPRYEHGGGRGERQHRQSGEMGGGELPHGSGQLLTPGASADRFSAAAPGRGQARKSRWPYRPAR